ncbi:hypothetical protein F5Y19DRAFT_465355 [Xylariaceae sp. FL1651]|nr:hypothetical protein F5Y19DRAFT_465355 [Xylariaceae sp. FL1651]
MFGSKQSSPRRDAPASRPDPDSDSASHGRTGGRRKRPRPTNDRNDRDDPPTAACDQCRLRKVRCDRRQPDCSNCQKAGIECNSSNTLKRVNHMKQLRDDFSDVLKQLSDVDHTLGTLADLARQIAARPRSYAVHPLSPPHQSQASDDGLPFSMSGLLDFAQCTSLDDRRDSADSSAINEPLCETIEYDQGGERLYSYPAPLVLFKLLLRQASSLLLDSSQQGKGSENGKTQVVRGLRDPVARATLQQKLDAFPFNSLRHEFLVASEISPVTSPPRLMVNLFVEGYLQNINMRTPIFDEDELHRAIDAHYSDEQLQENRAWALIMNNIVLLELGLEIQTSRASHSTSRGTNDDILPSFLRNCDRAIGNLDAFMAPSLANLQALMTLTLAAQEFYNNGTAERVCHAACQVGRVMGIHRSKDRRQGTRPNITPGSEKGRGRLFRILYSMDKQRVFMTGQPCDLHMFDTDHHIGPSRDDKHDNRPISDAFDHLMTIWEEIYLNLYSSRAVSAGAETRARQMRVVTNSIERFGQIHARLMVPPSANDMTDADLLRMELVYGYQVSQIIVLQCDQDNEQSLNKLRDLARSSLGLILEVCKPSITTARFALLARMFRRYPMVNFVELVALRLASLSTTDEFDSVALADISLLRAICDQLASLQYDNLTKTFYARLNSGVTWALDTLEALAEVLIRPPPPQGQAGFSQQSKDNRRPTEPSCNPTNPPSSIVLDISNDCAFPVSRGSQATSQPASSRHGEDDFGQSRPAQMTNFGFFTPDTDRGVLAPRSLSPVCQPGGSSFPTSQPQLDLASGPLSGTDWSDFSLDFFQGAFTQENRWE